MSALSDNSDDKTFREKKPSESGGFFLEDFPYGHCTCKKCFFLMGFIFPDVVNDLFDDTLATHH